MTMTHLATEIKSLAVSPGRLAIFWLGGAGLVFKADSGPVVAVDPYLSDSLDHFYAWKRLPLSPIPLPPAELGADLVLATHAHEDHLDPETIPDLARTSSTIFAGPGMCAEAMHAWGIGDERIVEINRGEQRDLAGVPVTAVLAHHVSNAGAQTPDAVGYIFESGGIRVYHTGDTLYHPDLQQVRDLRPHVMLVCINGDYGNMGPEDAARLTAEIEPAVVIPMHWGLVAENTTDPDLFVRALAATGSKSRPVVMLPGDCYVSSFAQI
jgi:L-ascorbate 6-phosphate lactonase